MNISQAQSHAIENTEDKDKLKSRFWKLTLGCVGVVYGDIGTSPLYAFRESAAAVAGADGLLQKEIYGILSLIIWALIIIVTLESFYFPSQREGVGGEVIMVLIRLAS